MPFDSMRRHLSIKAKDAFEAFGIKGVSVTTLFTVPLFFWYNGRAINMHEEPPSSKTSIVNLL